MKCKNEIKSGLVIKGDAWIGVIIVVALALFFTFGLSYEYGKREGASLAFKRNGREITVTDGRGDKFEAVFYGGDLFMREKDVVCYRSIE